MQGLKHDAVKGLITEKILSNRKRAQAGKVNRATEKYANMLPVHDIKEGVVCVTAPLCTHMCSVKTHL